MFKARILAKVRQIRLASEFLEQFRFGSIEDLDRAVADHLNAFSKAAPSAIAATKRLLTDVYGRRPADVLALTVDNIAAQRVSPEGQEGLRAFLDKRPAAWVKNSDT